MIPMIDIPSGTCPPELEQAFVDAINLSEDAKSTDIADVLSRLLGQLAKHKLVEIDQAVVLHDFARRVRDARFDGDRVRTIMDEFEVYCDGQVQS